MNKFNAEGYYDPTAYGALSKIQAEERKAAYKPLVYIASPFAGDIPGNIERAKDYCRFAVGKGFIPLAPHLLYPQFMDDGNAEERKQGLFFACVLLGKCEELWVMGDIVSNGMAKEIKKAEKRGLPIRRFNSSCEEVIVNAKP